MDPATLIKAELWWYRVLVGPWVAECTDLGRHIGVIFIVRTQPIRTFIRTAVGFVGMARCICSVMNAREVWCILLTMRQGGRTGYICGHTGCSHMMLRGVGCIARQSFSMNETKQEKGWYPTRMLPGYEQHEVSEGLWVYFSGDACPGLHENCC